LKGRKQKNDLNIRQQKHNAGENSLEALRVRNRIQSFNITSEKMIDLEGLATANSSSFLDEEDVVGMKNN